MLSLVQMIFLVSITLVTMSCTTQMLPYHTSINNDDIAEKDCGGGNRYKHCLEEISTDDGSFKLGFVEFDEYGHLFNRRQMSDLMSQLNEMNNNPIIFTFVHGWRHNASNADDNLQAFRDKTLRRAVQIENELAKQNGNSPRPVVGIYVGWRGESIKELFLGVPSIITFWDRKNAAHSVGNGGGVVDLYLRLSDFRKSHEHSRLVYIGHSFGGAVTYSTLNHALIDQLKGNGVAHPVGDLVVLINPAFEAMRYRPLYELSTSRSYEACKQRPLLVVMTTEDDIATRYFFPIGRFFSTFFDEYVEDDDDDLNTTAIGHHIPYITHSLRKASMDEELCNTDNENFRLSVENFDKLFSGKKSQESVESNKYCFGKVAFLNNTNLRMMITRCDNPGDCANTTDKEHHIKKGLEGFPLNNPLVNIRTTGDIMDGHGDIWNEYVQVFLTEFISITLAKASDENSVLKNCDDIPLNLKAPALLK